MINNIIIQVILSELFQTIIWFIILYYPFKIGITIIKNLCYVILFPYRLEYGIDKRDNLLHIKLSKRKKLIEDYPYGVQYHIFFKNKFNYLKERYHIFPTRIKSTTWN